MDLLFWHLFTSLLLNIVFNSYFFNIVCVVRINSCGNTKTWIWLKTNRFRFSFKINGILDLSHCEFFVTLLRGGRASNLFSYIGGTPNLTLGSVSAKSSNIFQICSAFFASSLESPSPFAICFGLPMLNRSLTIRNQITKLFSF